MFSGSTQAVRRFSLLLLEEGELYVEDFVAAARWPPAVAGNWQRLPRLAGQLRLCTKSLFFEPDDVRVPIVRLPFQYVEGMEGSGERRLLVAATRVIKMRANAADAPYVVERAGPGEAHPAALHWEFELSYTRLEGVVPLAQRMMVASRLPAAEQEEFLQATMAAAEAGLRFDLGGLRSPAERIEAELPATLLSQGALVREPGRLLITHQRLYFQPLHNIGGDAAVRSHPLAAVAAAARRRSALRDLALEVFFAEEGQAQQQQLATQPFWGGASALFAFASREERERAVAALTAQAALGTALPGGKQAAAACTAILEADPSWLSRVTAAWQRGLLSNLDYLLFLNLASGRSFSDLSQYPIFPWILADYSSPSLDLADPATFRDLSRPVGALNPRRLAMLRERYADMAGFSPEPPFLYGSHYSTPGFTMFWLVRAAPAHMLRLQNGRFDAPDRLFCSVRDAWEGVTSSNPADVKELIPEFFLRHDFLLNLRGLGLGTRQSGRPVGDVELPPWAADARHFQAAHRAALEAPFVSANLNHWVDLVFGFKQQGEAAVEADNVFRHTAYEGAVDIEAVADRTERLALETQIAEFGQCPRQLFRQKHPQRLVCPAAEVPPPGGAAAQPAAGAMGGGSGQALALVSAILALVSASQGPGESPRVEVPPQLAELDVLAARLRQQAADAAAAAAAAAAVAAADGPDAPGSAAAQLAAGSSGGMSVRSESGNSLSKQPGAPAAAGSRLRSLGAWAAERKQAVGERLAGSVGAVREAAAAALAGPPAGGGAVSASGSSTSRLQSLFARKGSTSASSSTADVAAAAADGPAGAGSPQQQGRSPPQSPGLVGSIGDRLSSFTLKGKPPGSPLPTDAGSAAAATDGGVGGSTPRPAAAVAGAPEAAAALGSPLWKFSGRATRPAPGQQPGLADGSSDEEVEAAARQQEHQPPQSPRPGPPCGSPATPPGPASPASPAASLLEAQRQRMLRAGAGGGSAAGGGGSPGRPTGWCGPGLRDRLVPTRVLVAGSESINGCALAVVAGAQHVYSASHSGQLRVHQLSSGEQVRACSISEQPLTSVALLGGGGGGSGGQRHPLALCGSFDACVHAYSPDFGRRLGAFQAATDAVACLQVVGGSGGSGGDGGGGGTPHRLVTASWDGSVKSWELGEGRQPWGGAAGEAAAGVQAPSGVWALAVSPEGHLVLAGTEDGLVAAWDLRQRPTAPLWRRQLLADNYVGALELCPGGAVLVVAAADGSLSLLDMRRSGAVAASVAPSGLPLRCCATDGVVALAGDEGGGLHIWHIGQQLGQQAPLAAGVWTPPRPDGLLPPLAADPPSAINALAAAPGGGASGGVDVVTGHEGGLLRWFSTSAAP